MQASKQVPEKSPCQDAVEEKPELGERMLEMALYHEHRDGTIPTNCSLKSLLSSGWRCEAETPVSEASEY